VYIFLGPGELRPDGPTPRIVRVGTHAVSRGSKTTLWNRLSTHRGSAASGGGNHRGSIFRRHVGDAFLHRPGTTLTSETWGIGSNAPRAVRDDEHLIERAVSDHIGSMPFVRIEADDEPSKGSVRGWIESNLIGLLSCASPSGASADPPSSGWLGRHCSSPEVRASGLWNVKETGRAYDPAFLGEFERLAEATPSLGDPKRRVVALVSCVKSKLDRPAPARDLYTSPLFRLSRSHAERHADAWFVLSALHGLVPPNRVIEPYEVTLNTMKAPERRVWAAKVHRQMRDAGLLETGVSFLWLAGQRYRGYLSERLAAFPQEDPLRGLGIGKRLAALSRGALVTFPPDHRPMRRYETVWFQGERKGSVAQPG